MAKGGKRPNAGRKPGSISKISKIAIEEASKTGDLPHIFLLKVSQGKAIDGVIPDLELRVDAAKAAAQFFAPKLAQIEQRIEAEVRAEISGEPLSVDEWDRLYGSSSGLLEATTGATEEPH